ncbi:unnamed protein product [Zymoseptoria tritici ST99CH_3D7]|uniref:Uncharacterized protein n=1 Tax=Zymoseptoria tritici (strain ST99CH_3D7) TaxID=1276538 RepID=A0A1X7S2I1_ZYMT9|nr:unnamed protein product [Zymoseptoria tritici ST99CH_3D7]
MHLLVGNNGQTGFSEAVEDLPVKLQSLTIHTYLHSSELAIFTNQLNSLKAKVVESFEVTFPDIYMSPTGGYSYRSSRAMFRNVENMSSKGRRFFLGYESYRVA